MVNVPPHEKDSVPADEKNRKVHDDGFFSQEHQEKWLLDNVFHWARNGVFFEAGGRDGIDYSNTYFMEKHLGWTGLVVEANPVLSKQLVKHRDCLTETVCLSDKENETVSYLAYDSGIAGIESSVETGRVKAQLGSRNIALENIRTPMKCKILTNIFVKYNIETVDFFSLDVEGHELQILKGLDLARICVYAFMIENNHNSQVVPNYLVQQGYAKVAHLYIDDLFVRKSPCPLPSSAAKIKEIISKSLKNH